PLVDGVLPGVTRDSVMTIARDQGYDVVERSLVRSDLYLADEAFFTGTAAEVVPIASIDDRRIGAGVPGPVTRELMRLYKQAAHGELDRYKDWVEPVAD
ncbi:MAG TPA: aminotransferase class IV, partial [Mycobacteriales bacterium]|nr:aminotransferase class IV [Mycobacteriales bacterium]